jgi:DNA-binding response OmpR family regulator
MEPRGRILIVDDDEEFVRMLAEFLLGQGFLILPAATGRRALELLESETPDLIVLDVMMPELDGLATLQAIRSSRDIPVIMVTARGRAQDRILGLELGADDYLAKPFDPLELSARIRAVLRRLRQGFRARAPLALGPLTLNPAAMTASLYGVEARLTSVEFIVLDLLASEPGGVQSRAALTERALGRPLSPFDRSVDTHISNIRRKLNLTPGCGVEIRAIRGAGYSLTVADDAP